jgi:hypothetical protein
MTRKFIIDKENSDGEIRIELFGHYENLAEHYINIIKKALEEYETEEEKKISEDEENVKVELSVEEIEDDEEAD